MEKLQNVDVKKYILIFVGSALGLYTLLNVDILLEIIGVLYVVKFAYNNLLFKQDRDTFLENLLGKLDNKNN